MTIQAILTSLSGIATAIGVAVAAWQLWVTRRIAQLSFEDSLNVEYRSLAMEIPVDALLGKTVCEDVFPIVREQIYNYIDLCNEQVFLRKKGRITTTTWLEWAEGIQSNLEKPTFRRVWKEIKESSAEVFKELRQFEESQFMQDPKSLKR